VTSTHPAAAAIEGLGAEGPQSSSADGSAADPVGALGEAPSPAVAGLMAEVLPFDFSSLEAGWHDFLDNVQYCMNDLALGSGPGRYASWIAVAALTTTAFELARRRLKPPPEEFIFEAADGRASGLKHPATWP
jgi:hypothetical protein